MKQQLVAGNKLFVSRIGLEDALQVNQRVLEHTLHVDEGNLEHALPVGEGVLHVWWLPSGWTATD